VRNGKEIDLDVVILIAFHEKMLKNDFKMKNRFLKILKIMVPGRLS